MPGRAVGRKGSRTRTPGLDEVSWLNRRGSP